MSDTELRVTAAPGELNSLTIAAEISLDASPVLVVTDEGAVPLAGQGCEADALAPERVICPATEVDRLRIETGDGDDRLETPTYLPVIADLGPGADLMVGGEGADLITGGAGDDLLEGGGGADQIDGGQGSDEAAGGTGADSVLMRDRRTDSVACGPGRDRVRAEVLDALDVACERVDYGAAGRVGRLRPITGGGRFVRVPGQPWASVDRRILRNVLYLIRKFHVQVGDGFAIRGHERRGEHPLGLAVDLYPGAGGSWRQVAKLARWAEPRQNRPRWPFRWVGWNGDFNHGWGNHLHLSWAHSPGRPGRPVRTVWVWHVRR